MSEWLKIEARKIAVFRLQRVIRGHLARKKYDRMKREEARRREEERKEKERRREERREEGRKDNQDVNCNRNAPRLADVQVGDDFVEMGNR